MSPVDPEDLPESPHFDKEAYIARQSGEYVTLDTQSPRYTGTWDPYPQYLLREEAVDPDVDADDVSYDNGDSGLDATNTQAALDEIASMIGSAGLDAEAVRDLLATVLVPGSNVTITPNDGADTVTIASTATGGLDAEAVRDLLADVLVEGNNINITPNDGANTVTIDATSAGVGNIYLLEYGEEPNSGDPEGVVWWKRPPPTVWDFTDGSLPDGWAARATPTSTSFDGTGMTSTYDAGDGYYIDLPAGTQGTLETHIVSSSHASKMFGPMLTTTSGNGGQSMWYSSPDDLIVGAVSAWSYGGSFSSGGGSGSYPSWLRLRYDGTQFFCSYSFDNITWSAESSGLTVSGLTMAALYRVSIGSTLGTVTSKISYVSWTAGPGSGGLHGWWNGTAIVSF